MQICNKRGGIDVIYRFYNMVAERNKQFTRASKKHCYCFIMYWHSTITYWLNMAIKQAR